MKISEEKFERLLRFLDAEMDPEEIAAFELEIKTDPDLREQLDFQVRLMGVFSKKAGNETEHIANTKPLQSILIAAKDKFLQYNDKILPPVIHIDPTAVLRNNDKYVAPVNMSRWLAAASVIGLALVSSLVYYSGKKHDNTDLVVNNNDTLKKDQPQITVINNIDTTQKRGNPSPKKMDYASLANESYIKDKGPVNPPQLLAGEISDYDAGNYKTIQAFDVNNIPKTRGVLDEWTIKELGHYYKGLSFIETKNNDQARLNLQWVIDNSKDRSLKIKAAWYEAIVCLKVGDVKKAELLLNYVSSNKTEEMYKQRAAVLIKKINEGK